MYRMLSMSNDQYLALSQPPERQAYLAASQALETITVLSLEEIDDITVVPLFVNLPFLLGRNLWR
jgi:hypothetical protein